MSAMKLYYAQPRNPINAVYNQIKTISKWKLSRSLKISVAPEEETLNIFRLILYELILML